MIEYFVGIDNSHSGAIAILDSSGQVVSVMMMPVDKYKECDYQAILDFIHKNGGGEHNTRVMLEEPIRAAFAQNSFRIMWSCFHRIKVALEMSGMNPDCILAITWQCKMLEETKDKKPKIWAEKKVNELWGRKFAKTKKECEGINDALLIAEFLRLQHQKNQ